jgi:sulfite reductase alpha subunit-like flavoprotein
MIRQAAAAVGSEVDTITTSSVPAKVNPNPTFRLPKDPEVPILMIAGGCGIAPIRAFIEERVALDAPKYGPCLLFLGFRSPDDEVYQPLIKNALAVGALTHAKITYSDQCEDGQKCMMVSDMVQIQGRQVWDHFQSGGYTYICGAARTFGAAVEAEIIAVIQKYGTMDFEDAQAYTRKMIKAGRLMEDSA